MEDRLEALRRVPLFAELGDEELKRVARATHEIEAPEGQVLIQPGTKGTGMFFVANSAAVTSVTVNYTTAGGVIKPGIMVMEISGAASSAGSDGSVNSGAAGDTTTSTSGSLTTTNANDILIFATDTSGNEAGWTAASGYAIPNNKLMIGASGSNVRMAMQVAVVSSVQTNTTTGMSYANSNWNGNIFAAFK